MRNPILESLLALHSFTGAALNLAVSPFPRQTQAHRPRRQGAGRAEGVPHGRRHRRPRAVPRVQPGKFLMLRLINCTYNYT